MLYLVVEHFLAGDAGPVYARLGDEGRRLPEGVTYLASWVTSDLAHCYQVLDCETRARLDDWMAAWEDLVRFEVISVVTSKEAQRILTDRAKPKDTDDRH